mgnify:CR=1 FL=1
MRDILSDFDAGRFLSDPDPVRRAQIQMARQLPKRFYDKVTTGPGGEGYTVLLDGRPIRTAAKRPVSLSSLKLAQRLAEEFDAQRDVLNPAAMPLYRLVNTALDAVADRLEAVRDDIVAYAGSDLLCYRAEEPEALCERQRLAWDPVLEKIVQRHGARFRLAGGIMHIAQDDVALAAIRRRVDTIDDPVVLAALHSVTTLTGSALLALALLDGDLDASDAWTHAHVDEDWNEELWGADEEAQARRAARWLEMQAAAWALGHA